MTSPIIAHFIPVIIENSTCDISPATIGTLFLCCVRVWTKIQERCCSLCFVIFTQRDVCLSRTLQHKHNMRREKRKKNDNTGESSKIQRMGSNVRFSCVLAYWTFPYKKRVICVCWETLRSLTLEHTDQCIFWRPNYANSDNTQCLLKCKSRIHTTLKCQMGMFPCASSFNTHTLLAKGIYERYKKVNL